MLKPLNDVRLADVIGLYNRSIAENPYSGRLDEALWTTLIASKPYYTPNDVIVAYDADEAVGYVHLCNAPNADHSAPAPATGSIEMLCFDPARPAIGRALVEEAVRLHRDRGAQKILACSTFAGYPLYRGIFVGLEPMAMGRDQHVVQAFLAGGFDECQHSVEMGIDYERAVPEPQPSVALDFSLRPWHPAPAWEAATWIGLEPYRTEVTHGEQVAGRCIYAVMPVISAKYGATVGCVAQLVTHPEWRRKGIGTFLIARALNHMLELGARRVTLGTQHDNWAAHATYRRNGFEIEADAFAFVLDLSH